MACPAGGATWSVQGSRAVGRPVQTPRLGRGHGRARGPCSSSTPRKRCGRPTTAHENAKRLHEPVREATSSGVRTLRGRAVIWEYRQLAACLIVSLGTLEASPRAQAEVEVAPPRAAANAGEKLLTRASPAVPKRLRPRSVSDVDGVASIHQNGCASPRNWNHHGRCGPSSLGLIYWRPTTPSRRCEVCC